MKTTLRTVLTTFALLSATASIAYADDYVMLKVDKEDISASEIDAMWKSLFPSPDAPAFSAVEPKIRDNVLRGIATEHLLYGEAVKQGVDKSPEVASQLEMLRKKLIVKQLLENKTQGVVKEADIKREYDRLVAKSKGTQEVRARHILVASEKEAVALKERLDKGEAFEKLAAEASKDPGSAKEGGDLGYFTKDKMVKSFADAAFALNKGQVSSPVKSDFGWHIIKVEDKRAVAAPAYADVKAKVATSLQEKALTVYVQQLLQGSDIKLFGADGKELPFQKIATPEKQ